MPRLEYYEPNASRFHPAVEVSHREHYEEVIPANAAGEFARSTSTARALALSGAEC
ncbi:hypothetical protein [Arthrobacter sp. GMC3]|uniref:hypothetical protein n=1 Tax=Arthrobacter sp. GMC3 TaxID=2058894 RepID=UPI0015E347CD|nr:hypothetical protein [Arthrobacter sp. GMC3]